MRCDRCGKKFSEELEIVPKKRGYTLRFRESIIEEVLSSDIKNVAKRNDISEQEIETMLKDIGEELKEEKPQDLKRLGLDEIAVVKGQKNYYVILVDLEKRKIVGMIEKRNKEELEKYLKSWGEEVLSEIEEVSIDLWQPYKSVAENLMPQAEIVADRFHVMKQVNEELDRERKKQKKVSEQEKITEIRKQLPRLGEMHRLKEEFRKVFEESRDWREGLLKLSDWLRESRELFPSSCQTIKRWIGEIIAYFDRRTTQGVVEGINNKLKLIKRRAYGFRNFDNFKLISFLNWHFST
jgi:transposase